jgi:hypothetical protein
MLVYSIKICEEETQEKMKISEVNNINQKR